jgi:potassium-transporting ATPase KdpC subunit
MIMREVIINSIKMLILMTILTGVIYPVMMTGIAQMIFHDKANGSVIIQNNKIIGSSLIGQKFTGDEYFWPRPSAIDYNPLPSGGSNYGMTSRKLHDTTIRITENFRMKNFLDPKADVPKDMMFSSASGLDPDISLESARCQVKRIANKRNMKEEQIIQLIDKLKEKPGFFIPGESRINVLLLNLELDKHSK